MQKILQKKHAEDDEKSRDNTSSTDVESDDNKENTSNDSRNEYLLKEG